MWLLKFGEDKMIKMNSKWKVIVALIVSLFLWSFSCANFVLFQSHSKGGEIEYKIGYFIISLLYSLLIFGIGGFKFKFNEKSGKIIPICAYILTMLGCMHISILFSDGFTGGAFLYLLNIVFYLFFAGFGLMISGSMRVSAIVALSVSFIYNCISFIIYSFRGNSLMPTDFMAITTAMNIASQYKFKLKYQLITASIYAVAHLMIAIKFPIKLEFKNKWWILRLCGLGTAIISALLIVCVDYSHYDVSVYDQHRANYEHGSAVGFYVNATKMGLKQTKNYSPETIDEKLLAYDIKESNTKNKPNIIVVMNESFADLKAVGDFKTNIDYMPYFNSLKKNTIKGETLVSPFGGYTCNSEYEFITGMNTGLLSAQSIPYMHMINRKMPYTLNTHMKQLGYNVTAIHPYYQNGWNRNVVYDYLGFDEFLSLGDFNKAGFDLEYVRNYIGDKSNYQMILNRLYQKESGEKEFIFNITMQNHGGYSIKEFDNEVKIENLNGNYPLTEQYLTLIKRSDEALEWFLNELKKFKEPVIVAMFGDHQPSVEEEFYEELYGKDLDDLTDEELSRRYITPFMIWANFDIKEEENIKTSPCFLSNKIMEVAKLPKSRVQLYLDDLKTEVMQLNPLGYYDNEGIWHSHKDCEELEHYYNIQYSLLNGENLNYDFVIHDREYDILGNYILSPRYLFKDEQDEIFAKYKQ